MEHATPTMTLMFYRRDGCTVCDEALDLLEEELGVRASVGRTIPIVEQVDVAKAPELEERYGSRLPVLAIDCATGENERLMRRDMMNDMAEMLETAGVREVRVYDNGYFPGMGIHEMGTARMGRDPKTSVLNARSQVWDAPNVFVTDGSCMTSSGCQNPSLTYMALTARAAAFAVDELKRGNL